MEKVPTVHNIALKKALETVYFETKLLHLQSERTKTY